MEKFGLLNLLKAIEALTPKNNPAAETEFNEKTDFNGADKLATASAQTSAKTAPAEINLENNVMANVLSRHEQMSNRVKNNRR